MTLGVIRKGGQSARSSGEENDCEVSSCEFKLQTARGIATFQRLARQLSDAGRLTAEMHLRLSRYALAADTVHDHQARGLPLRASLFDQLRRAERDLGLDEKGQTSAASQPVQENKWARCGFASRARERS
jgi:hypothetical protein